MTRDRSILSEIDHAHASGASRDANDALAPGLLFGTASGVTQAVKRCLGESGPGSSSRVQRALASCGRRLHEDVGTLTPAVEMALRLMTDGPVPLLLLAHQPICMPYDGVSAQHRLMNWIARQIPNAVAVQLVVDTDSSSERYFRSCRVPSPKSSKGYLTISPSARLGQYPMCFPTALRPERVRSEVERAHVNLSEVAAEVERRTHISFRHDLDSLQRVVDDPLPESLADFNTQCISRLVNKEWSLPTVFVRHSDLLRSLASNVAELAVQEERLRSIYELFGWSRQSAFYWVLCGQCGSRLGVDNNSDWFPCKCGHRQAVPAPSIDVIGDGLAAGEIIPRIELDDLVFGVVLKPDLMLSYQSSAPHVLRSQMVLDVMGRHQAHVLWRPRPIRAGPVEIASLLSSHSWQKGSVDHAVELSLSGRASMVYGLLLDDPKGVEASWTGYFASNLLSEPCVLDPGAWSKESGSLSSLVDSSRVLT
jgi:hypothetical protein